MTRSQAQYAKIGVPSCSEFRDGAERFAQLGSEFEYEDDLQLLEYELPESGGVGSCLAALEAAGMSKHIRRKCASSKWPKSKLGLPDLDHSKVAVLG